MNCFSKSLSHSHRRHTESVASARQIIYAIRSFILARVITTLQCYCIFDAG